MIILFTTLCIANMVIHYGEVEENPENAHLSGPEVFHEVLKKYWASLLGAFIAVLFSIFVFSLCGFHTYLVQKALTTNEKLKGIYSGFAVSPFSHGRVSADWGKVVCWPRVNHTRLYYMLYLKCQDTDKFDQLREAEGEEILPSEMLEPSYDIY